MVLPVEAAPSFWQPNPSITPTPAPPSLQEIVEPSQYKVATPTPQAVPEIQFATPTPTPLPWLKPKNPTKSAILSAIIPGLGQVDAGDPWKGLGFAAVFGVGLWQTLYNFQLVPQPNNIGLNGSRNEDLGHLFGLITLAAYGFGVQDAYSTAVSYNHRNHLAFSFGIEPRPSVDLAYLF
jgi:hypothetical protein